MLLALLASIALSIACAALSVFVVSRHWAFIGEGISHSAFGGAGTAWVLALLFPRLENGSFIECCVVLFCVLTGAAIGFLSDRKRTNADAAIGIFMVASLAWGFLAADIFRSVRHGAEPLGFADFLFGQMSWMSANYALTTITLSAAVIAVLVAFGKEILYCSFDPEMARVSGVPAGLIHYLLLLLVTLTIVLGIRLAGSVLITALLVLPAATALLLTERLTSVFVIAIATAVIGTAAGVIVHLTRSMVPAGPAIVLSMFLEFLICFTASRIRFTHRATS